MSDRDKLIQAICAEPAADGPILALADWFEEYGPDESAETCRWWMELRQRVREQVPAGNWPPLPDVPDWPAGTHSIAIHRLAAYSAVEDLFHRGCWAKSRLCALEVACAALALKPTFLAAPRSPGMPQLRPLVEDISAWIMDALDLLPFEAYHRVFPDTRKTHRTIPPGRLLISCVNDAVTSADCDRGLRYAEGANFMRLAAIYFRTAVALTPAPGFMIAAA
jgi:uncharacterized protein (TIGR02996 family)